MPCFQTAFLLSCFSAFVETSCVVFGISTSLWNSCVMSFQRFVFLRPSSVLLAFFHLEFPVFTNESSTLTLFNVPSSLAFLKWCKIHDLQLRHNTAWFTFHTTGEKSPLIFSKFSFRIWKSLWLVCFNLFSNTWCMRWTDCVLHSSDLLSYFLEDSLLRSGIGLPQ